MERKIVHLLKRHGGDDDGDGGSMAGMTMSSAQSSAITAKQTAGAMMTDGFHAGDSNALWSDSFVPSTGAAVFGACILLVFLAILTRFLDALHRSLVLKWATQATQLREMRGSDKVPFIARNDIVRGLYFFLHAGLLYLLMLAVMTYNVYYFISILIGLGIGETMFGRFGRSVGPSKALQSDPVQHDRRSSEITPLHTLQPMRNATRSLHKEDEE